MTVRIEHSSTSTYALWGESEVELPSRYLLWEVSLLIRQSKPDLDNLEQVDVTPHGLVMIVRRRLERAYRPCDDSRKLRVLRIDSKHERDEREWRAAGESRTIAMYGYLSMRSRMLAISVSRFGAHTSRIRDIIQAKKHNRTTTQECMCRGGEDVQSWDGGGSC